jgi:MATE family multidrug resistance protein
VALPLVAVFAFLFDGIFIGATRTAEMRNGMALALAVFLGSVTLLMPPFGNHGLWLAMLLLMAARGLWLGACYLRIERKAGFVAAPAPGKPA